MTTLTFKNLSKDEILNRSRNIKYACGRNLYGFENVVEQTIVFSADVQQLSLQADVFAREFLRHKSLFDYKRFLGPDVHDWTRLLHETYVYDRCKSIYYGLNYNNIMEYPDNCYSFPGHVALKRFLQDGVYQYSTNDENPFSYFIKVNYNRKASEILDPIFEVYPDVRQGISDNPSVISYVNTTYETILNGIANGKTYLESYSSKGNNKKDDESKLFFQIVKFNCDTTASNVHSDENNPLTNSFLSLEGDKFYFILSKETQVKSALRFNESVFLARALGFKSKQLFVEENSMYCCVPRNYVSDPFTRDEVYSVTGIKSEIVPYSDEQIKEYLSINTLKDLKKNGNGNGLDTENQP